MRSTICATMLIAVAQLGPASAASAASASNPATYPLPTCIVTGKPVGAEGEPIAVELNGREIRFCSKECVKEFEKATATYLEKLDQAIIEEQLPIYPLTTCIVSGEALGGEMGEPANHVIQNRLVRFCCDGCRPGFDKDPASFFAKLDEATIAAQMKDYPADACPVSGEKLGSMGEPFDYIVAGRLVRLCCAGCLGSLDRDPGGALMTVYGEMNVEDSELQEQR